MYVNFYQSKPCTQICLQKIANCINLQLAIRISKNHAFGHALPHNRHSGQFWDQRLFKLNISIGLLEINLPQKDIDTHGRTDGMTDGRTDIQTSRTTTIGSFFKKNTKNKRM